MSGPDHPQTPPSPPSGLAAADGDFVAQLRDLDLGSIAASADPMLIVDRNMILRAYNAAYVAFAAANGLPDIEQRFGVGSDMLAAFSEPARTFYGDAYRRVLDEQNTFHQRYECSSPSQRRLFLLSAYASVGGKSLVIAHHLTIEEPIPITDQQAISTTHCSPEGFVIQCCHCRKVRNFLAPDRWDWVPDLIAQRPSNVSHTFCPRCFDHYYPDVDG